ncbi:MAG: energy transducer TonB [Bryobacteraceae bacterium]
MGRATLLSVLALAICFAQDASVRAPFEGRQFSAEQAAAAEAAVAANPDDVSDRLKLLGYYWVQAQAGGSNDLNHAEVNHAARLTQLLWLIAHNPELGVFVLPEASLPDAGDYEQVKPAWGQAVTTHFDDGRVLANAAWFYRILDKQQSVDLLRRALASNPQNRQIAGRLGNEYAVILAGVKEVDASGRASRFEPAEASSALAQTVRAELEQSTQATVLHSAGSALKDYTSGSQIASAGVGDLNALSNQLIERAKALDPTVLPQRIRVGGNVQAANLIKKVTPVYPPEAKQARLQGTVRFSVIIAKDGTVENIQLISGHPLLVPAALEAVKQWVYKPTLLNGLPVEVATTLDINFTLTK